MLTRMAFLPYGLYLVSHSQEKEIATRTGRHSRIIPTLPEKAHQIVIGLVDLILFCDVETVTAPDGQTHYRRVIRTRPSARYDAGDRTGRLPETLSLDYDVFAAAFHRGADPASVVVGTHDQLTD